MKQKTISESVNSFLDRFPMFKRKVAFTSNGDTYAETVQITPEEAIQEATTNGVDDFVQNVSKLSNMNLTDRFEAIDRLNAAIADIKYEKPSETKDDEK